MRIGSFGGNAMIYTEKEWILRILCAAIAGGLIGYERHSQSKEAGIRTHAIVAMGSALIMVLSKYGFSDINSGDPARLAAQVVSGIGFLGAGVIFVRHNVIQGMATAAGIWGTSAIGLAYGTGMYLAGTLATILMLVIQITFNRNFRFGTRRIDMQLLLSLRPEGTVQEVTAYLKKEGYEVSGIRIFESREDGTWLLEMEVYARGQSKPIDLLSRLRDLKNVEKAEFVPPED